MDKNELKPIPWTLSGGTLALVLDGQPKTMESDHPNFAAVLSALRCKEWDVIPDLTDMAQSIRKFADGRIQVTEDEVFYLGQPIANSLTDRLLWMLRDGAQNLTPMVNFLENCIANPNKGAVDRIFTFLEKSHLPLTPDGCFLAYRGVNEDFTDKHSGTFDNSPGKIVKMPRKQCDEDSNQCCSSGLHFCSLPYLGPEGHWAGGRDNLIVVKINPRDVVAVPYTYADTKGRCCRFEVLRVWQAADKFKNLSEDAWSVSLVAETDEVTSPAVRAMLNLERLNEALEDFELEPDAPKVEYSEDDSESSDEDSGDYEPYEGEDDDPCFDCDGEDCGDCQYAEDIHDDTCPEEAEESKLSVSLLPEEDLDTVIEGAYWTKDSKKEMIGDLYRLALRSGKDVFAFRKDQDHKTQGDIKVTPKGNVLEFTASTQRWAACYRITT